MKKLIIPLLVSGLLIGTAINNASAQIRLDEVTISGASNKAMVTEKVNKSFNRMFKEADQARWIEVNKRFIVNFIMDNQKNKAVFTKGGDLVYHLVYGTEKELPTDIRTTVRSKYFDYSITSTVNVKLEGRSIWIVNIEDAKKIMVIRIEDGTMDIVDNINKA